MPDPAFFFELAGFFAVGLVPGFALAFVRKIKSAV